MILLFPKYLKRMALICAAYVALVAVLLALNPGRGVALTLVIAAIGLVLVVISQLLNAAGMNMWASTIITWLLPPYIFVLFGRRSVDGGKKEKSE